MFYEHLTVKWPFSVFYRTPDILIYNKTYMHYFTVYQTKRNGYNIYIKKVNTVMINKATNINKTNNHL